jgi:rRNA processing protein Gar1
MAFQIARGRKSGKPFLMVKCLRNGRHFRGFIGDQVYVRKLLERLERGNGNEPVMKSEQNLLVP